MTSPELGALGYGAANLGNLSRELTDEESWEILDASWDAGIRYFDTAPHYGLGLSERRLGAFLRTKPRHEFIISTKVGRLLRPNDAMYGERDSDFMVPADLVRIWDPSEAGVRASLEESLQRLGLDAVDILYLHDPEKNDLERSLNLGLSALEGVRREGLVSAIGVGSMFTPALLASARSGAIDLLMVAGRYTLLEQTVFPDVLDACTTNGVGIVNASIFNSGLLARAKPDPTASYEYGTVPAIILERAQRLAETCALFGTDLPTAALHYSFRDSRVHNTIVGANNGSQLRESAARMASAVPEELWSELVSEGLIPE